MYNIMFEEGSYHFYGFGVKLTAEGFCISFLQLLVA